MSEQHQSSKGTLHVVSVCTGKLMCAKVVMSILSLPVISDLGVDFLGVFGHIQHATGLPSRGAGQAAKPGNTACSFLQLQAHSPGRLQHCLPQVCDCLNYPPFTQLCCHPNVVPFVLIRATCHCVQSICNYLGICSACHVHVCGYQSAEVVPYIGTISTCASWCCARAVAAVITYKPWRWTFSVTLYGVLIFSILPACQTGFQDRS